MKAAKKLVSIFYQPLVLKVKKKSMNFAGLKLFESFFERRSKSSMNDLKNVHPNIKHTSTNLPFHDFSISYMAAVSYARKSVNFIDEQQ